MSTFITVKDININMHNVNEYIKLQIYLCHDSNMPSFKFFKSSSPQLYDVQYSSELFEVYLHLNYSKFKVHLNYPNLKLHLNYPAFKFHFNFRHIDFYFNYSTIVLDLMFKKSNIEYRMLIISVR